MHARKELKEASLLKNRNKTAATIKNAKIAQQNLDELYKEEKEKYIQSQIDEIKGAADNKKSSSAWSTINRITGRKKSNKSRLKAKDDEERLKLWKEHFKNLLGKHPVTIPSEMIKIVDETLPIKIGPFTENELQSVIKAIKNKKSAGLDEIPPEVWKSGMFDQELLMFCNQVYNQEDIEAWCEGCILPFPKKGDLGVPGNYRGITLTAIAAKIYNKLLLNRIQPEIEKILRRNQNGFRKNRSTTGQILSVRRLIEGINAKNLQATLLFVDFTKAFDSIDRGKLEQILYAYGIPNETIAAIMMLYKHTKAKVRSPDGDTEFFDVLAGVLQGDTFAPFLFIIALDYILRTTLDINKHLGFTISKSRSPRHPAVTITDADYADDLALFSNNCKDAERMLHLLESAAATIGLNVNAGKTEQISYNQNGTINTINAERIKLVDDFTYLGSSIASTEKDIDIRIAKAWSSLNKLTCIWKSNLSDELKRNFFRMTTGSASFYGSITWTFTKKLENKINGSFTRML